MAVRAARGARARGRPGAGRAAAVATRGVVGMAAQLQFIKGVPEKGVPEVKLTRSRDGQTGAAIFQFPDPSVFQDQEDAGPQGGDITGLYMIDDEGELSTQDVTASFINGKPDIIEATYVMRSSLQWDRFMRFMERYAESNGLGFNKA